MFRSGICQERDWGSSWAQVGQSRGSHMLLPSQLWAHVWALEDTHITQLCTPTAVPGFHKRVCALTHTHTHTTVMHRHQGTSTDTQSLCMTKTPVPHLSPLQLSESFTPGARPGRQPFFLGPTFSKPLSPTLSGPATHPSCGLSHPEAHRVWHSTWGRGGGRNQPPPSQIPLPPHSCPGTSPTQDQAPPAHPLALPPEA